MRTDVAALYVDPRGPYPQLVKHWYDEGRDARTYAGPWPVVAHPPCGPWGKLRHLSTRQASWCGPHAVAIVRRLGGVLEHPEHSLLFAHCGLPRPGELPDAFGGRTIAIQQVDWGHVARKRTWLYLVGLSSVGVTPPPREPTHWISGTHERRRRGHGAPGVAPRFIKICSAEQRRRTPMAFAEWLLELASRAHRSVAA